jgi:hypothetical protein
MGVEGNSCRFLRMSRSTPMATTEPGFNVRLEPEGAMEMRLTA